MALIFLCSLRLSSLGTSEISILHIIWTLLLHEIHQPPCRFFDWRGVKDRKIITEKIDAAFNTAKKKDGCEFNSDTIP